MKLRPSSRFGKRVFFALCPRSGKELTRVAHEGFHVAVRKAGFLLKAAQFSFRRVEGPVRTEEETIRGKVGDESPEQLR